MLNSLEDILVSEEDIQDRVLTEFARELLKGIQQLTDTYGKEVLLQKIREID